MHEVDQFVLMKSQDK